MKDYSVQVKVKNNWFLTKMRDAGFDSAAELSRSCGVSQQDVGKLLNLQVAPTNAREEWRQQVIKISEALKCLPEDLFPPQHIRAPLAKNTSTFEVSRGEIALFLSDQRTPEQTLINAENAEAVELALLSLKPREERILRMRFGINTASQTLDDCANECGVTRERIRQIEAKAFRKLRKKRDL